MVYAVTEHGVVSGSKLADVNKTMNAAIEKDELVSCGSDYFINMTNKDIEFVQDKKKLTGIMFGNFFKKDNRTFYLSMVGIVLAIANFITINNCMNLINKLIEYLNTLKIS